MTQDNPDVAPAQDESAIDVTLRDVPHEDGATGQAAVHIRLDASVHQQMQDYADTDTSLELGGILIGTVEESATSVVTVEAMIPARYTEAVQSSITFTHRTWQDIYEVKDRAYPDKKIIGWYHTHPGFGIFLSNYDMHIHRNFFTLPWQVAYVVDPLASTEGFFRWEGGNIQKVTDYEIIGKEPPVPSCPSQHDSRQWLKICCIIIILLLVIFSILVNHYLRASAKPFSPPLQHRTPPVSHPSRVQHPSTIDRPRTAVVDNVGGRSGSSKWPGHH